MLLIYTHVHVPDVNTHIWYYIHGHLHQILFSWWHQPKRVPTAWELGAVVPHFAATSLWLQMSIPPQSYTYF